MSDIKLRKLRFYVEQYYDLQMERVAAFNRLTCMVRDYIGMNQVLKELVAYSVNKLKKGADIDINQLIGQVDRVVDPTLSLQDNVDLLENALGITIIPVDEPYAWYVDRLLRGKAIIPATDLEDIIDTCRALAEDEDQMRRKIEDVLQEFDVYTEYMSKVRGMGATYSGALIAWTAPISRFEYSSRLRAYAGLTAQHYELECEKGHKIIATNVKEVCPVPTEKKGKKCGARITKVREVKKPPKRKRGYYVMVNMRLKALGWKIARSFEFQKTSKSYYRYLYDRIKAYYSSRPDLKKATKARIRNMALLWVASMFYNHYWEVYRRLEGLPVTEPYPIAKLGHTVKIIPMVDMGESKVVPTWSGSIS